MKSNAELQKVAPELRGMVKAGFFVCYNCKDGLCSECVGVPCMCPCPVKPKVQEPEYSI